MQLEIEIDGTEDVARHIDDDQLSGPVREAFAELSLDQQQAIRCRVIDELSYEEVATRLGINAVTARTRVSRGLQTLRAMIRGAHP